MPRGEGDHPLRPHLEETEVQLQEALSEVCEDEAEVELRNTDELIQIDEALAIASEAAKRAISLRKRIGVDEDGSSDRDQPTATPQA